MWKLIPTVIKVKKLILNCWVLNLFKVFFLRTAWLVLREAVLTFSTLANLELFQFYSIFKVFSIFLRGSSQLLRFRFLSPYLIFNNFMYLSESNLTESSSSNLSWLFICLIVGLLWFWDWNLMKFWNIFCLCLLSIFLSSSILLLIYTYIYSYLHSYLYIGMYDTDR